MKQLFITCLMLIIVSSTALGMTKKITVSKDGRGDFKTVQGAIDAVKDLDNSETIIYIKMAYIKENFICLKARYMCILLVKVWMAWY